MLIIDGTLIKDSFTSVEFQGAGRAGSGSRKRSKVMNTTDSGAESFTQAMVCFIIQILLQLPDELIKRDAVVSFKK